MLKYPLLEFSDCQQISMDPDDITSVLKLYTRTNFG